MVYPGGPSRGCYTCRARKVKCDETRPVCQRCVKGNWTCGGYRVLPSKTTSSKRSEQALRSPRYPSPAHKEKEPMTTKLASLSTCPATILGDAQSQDQANLCAAFYSQLLRLPQVQGLHGGFLTTLPSILAELKQPSSSPLPPALSALLLTFVSEKGNSKNRRAMTEAMGCYVKALQLTRQLVEERSEQRATEVIMTIFVLGMYEDFTCEDHTKYTSNSHLEGAMAFVRTQECKDFVDGPSRKIYGAILARAFFTCFDSKDNTPFILTIDELHALHAALSKEKDTDVLILYTCTLLIIHLQLREIEKGVCSPFSSEGALFNAAMEANHLLESIVSIENQISEWPSSLPSEWNYLTIQLPSDGSDLLRTDAQVYSTFSAGNDWARYRTLRILIHTLRLRAFRLLANPLYTDNHSGYEYNDAQLASLTSAIAVTHGEIGALANDICASMPYHLGYRDRSGTELRYPSEAFPNEKYARRMSACQVAWPLYVAGIVEGVDIEQRLWISRQLDFINREMGIGKAAVLAEMVRRAAVLEVQGTL
ncbi:Zn(II)2Cys6 transcription factor domain-containing protein [Aspergillus lucknowensis]|uniref:Zn(2)-C6 fungal-type domain-containing protein n=1 Tax=Aspergillus lucknowensis TaxID=176173 RepID=A0ABR4LW74_9EURO